ncbi:MAG: HK97 family phage prohead protease [Rhizobiaceae bacterium]|nr:HK97 family phage prohead protease [Rhizobiaceae bacterium]
MDSRALARLLDTKRADLALARVDEQGEFSGYASLFGETDLAHDVVERGAFAESLAKRGAGRVRMLFQHDPNQPIGVWTHIAEDERGLFVKGRLTQGVGRAAEVLSLMRAGALDGLSIGFRTVRASPDKSKGVRRILEADLWEISVVTFPMLPSARVSVIKACSGSRDEKQLAARIRSASRMFNERNEHRWH